MTPPLNQSARKVQQCPKTGIKGRLMLSIVVLAAAPFAGVLLATEPDGRAIGAPADQWSVDFVDTIREVGYGVSVAIDPLTDESFISY